LLPSYTTILKSLILIRPFISLHKNGEGLLIVVCVKVAENRLLLQGKIKTLGLIFSHETAGLLASFTTISKSLIHIRTLISLHKNGEGLFFVVLVLEASLASSTGKFETKARILGMRHRRWLLPSITTIEKSFVIKFLGKYLPQFLLGQLQCISDHVFQ